MRWLVILALSLACRRAPPVAPDPSVSTVEPAAPSAAARSWYLQAVVAEERGDLDHADKAWAWVAREDRTNAHAQAHYARFLQRQRRWSEAEQAWNLALRRAPSWWEPMVALGALAGRRGDEGVERQWLSKAIAHGAEGRVYERAIELYERAGQPAEAVRLLEAWLDRPADDRVDRKRRAQATRRLLGDARALSDLAVLARASDEPFLAATFVQTALQVCERGQALAWARRTTPEDGASVALALEVAEAVGDLPLVERLLDLRVAAGDEPPSVAPPEGALGWAASPGVPPQVRLVVGWRALGRPERADAHLRAVREDPALGPWARVLAPDLDARRDSAALPLAVAVELARGWPSGRVTLAHVVDALGSSREAPVVFAAALAELGGELPADRAPVRHELSAPAAIDGRLALPAHAYDRFAASRAAQAIARAMDAGDRVAARRHAERWSTREPDRAEPYLALARIEPDRADRHLTAALDRDPCSAEALLALSKGAAPDRARELVQRAVQAQPLDPVVRAEAAALGLPLP